MARQQVFRLRIRLEGTDPPVWRRVLVPGEAKMSKLHDIFQASMGWTNCHMHSFTIDDELYGMQFDDYPEEELDETEFTVSLALRGEVRRFVYEYDLADSWNHEVVVEELMWSEHALKYGVCLEGEGACPPEDVGGAPGYARFLEALRDPLHKEHDNYIEWLGYGFDPDVFSVAVANVALQRVR